MRAPNSPLEYIADIDAIERMQFDIEIIFLEMQNAASYFVVGEVYLGSVVTYNNDITIKMKRRIVLANDRFNYLGRVTVE